MALLHALARRSMFGLIKKAQAAAGSASSNAPSAVSGPMGTAYAVGGFAAGLVEISNIDRFDMAGEAITAMAALDIGTASMGGASNASIMIAAAGLTSNTKPTATYKFSFADDSRTSGTALSVGQQSPVSLGNAQTAIFAGGYNDTGYLSSTDKYTYATNAVVAGANLSVARYSGYGLGNQSVGYAAAGYNGSGNLASVDKYDYATDSIAALSPVLGQARMQGDSGGNGKIGVMMGGSNNNGVFYANVDVFDYAMGTFYPGTALSVAKCSGSAAGSQSVAYQLGSNGGVASGVSASIDKYDLTKHAITTSKASLSVARSCSTAASNVQNGLEVDSGLAQNTTVAPTGMYAGGWNGSNYSAVVDRLDMNSGTVTTDTSLSVAMDGLTGISNNTAGLMVGGTKTGSTSTAELAVSSSIKYSYAKRTQSAGGSLANVLHNAAGISTNATGIIQGGYSGTNDTAGNAQLSGSFKYAYASDTTTAATALTTPRANLGAASNSAVGIAAGGTTNNQMATALATLSSYTFATDASANLSVSLSTARVAVGGASSEFNAYFQGGAANAAPYATTTVDKYSYSGNTISAGTALTTAVEGLAIAGSSTASYGAGGDYNSWASFSANVQKYDMTTDTVSSPASLSFARSAACGISNAHAGLGTYAVDQIPSSDGSGVNGYVPPVAVYAGGSSPNAYQATVDRLEIATATVTSATGLSKPMNAMTGISNDQAGYFVGGATNNVATAVNAVATSVKYAYATHTRTAGAQIGNVLHAGCGIGTTSVGILQGGFSNNDETNAALSGSFKYTYASETTTSATALTTPRANVGGSSNTELGVIAGGTTSNSMATVMNTMSSYTFATDASANLSVTLSSAREGVAGLSSDTAGYFLGGAANAAPYATTTVDKYSYSQGSIAAATALTTAYTGIAVGADSRVGYLAGGDNNSWGTYGSSINKYDTTTDTNAVVSATLSTARAVGAAISNSHAGLGLSAVSLVDHPASATTNGQSVFAGGYVSGESASSSVYTHATDAVAAGASLTVARHVGAAVSNKTAGFAAGGWNGSNQATTVDKYTYSGNTVAGSTALASGAANQAGSGNNDLGVIVGGVAANGGSMVPSNSAVQLLNYANATWVTTAALASFRDAAAFSNGTQVIAARGFDGYSTVLANVDKYSIALNTWTTATPLSVARRIAAAVSNSAVGAVMGGVTSTGTSSIDSSTALTTVERYDHTSGGVRTGTSLGSAGWQQGSGGCSAYGLIAGGANSSGAVQASTVKYSFTADTINAGTNLDVGRGGSFGMSNQANGLDAGTSPSSQVPAPGASAAAGTAYFSGGNDGVNYQTRTEKYNLGIDAVTSGTALPSLTRFAGSLSSTTAGYVLNGDNNGNLNQTEKYTYSNDALAASTLMGPARAAQTQNLGNSFVGILTAGTSGDVTETYKRAYATEGVVASTHINSHVNHAFAHSNPFQGFVMGGQNASGGSVLSTDCYTYASDAVTAAAGLSSAIIDGAAFSNKDVAILAGGVSGSSELTTVTGFSYATGALSSAAPLLTASGYASAGGNAKTGIIAGGYSGSFLSQVQKYTYQTNSWANGAALSGANSEMAGFGPTVGGLLTSTLPSGQNDTNGQALFTRSSAMDRFDFATETMEAEADVAIAVSGGAGISDVVAARFVNSRSTLKETWATGARTNPTGLPSGSNLPGRGASNNAVGILTGGTDASSVPTTNRWKYTFAGDTVVSTTALTTPIGWSGETGNQTMSYTAGGATDSAGSVTAAVVRADYATDTQSAGAALSVARSKIGGFSSVDNAFFAGGQDKSLVAYGTVDKYNYGNQTVLASSLLTPATRNPMGACNPSTGMAAGGLNPSSETLATALFDFATESWSVGPFLQASTASGRSAASSAHAGIPLTATASVDFTQGTAYFSGGWNGSANISNTSKYGLSTDAVAAGTALSTAKRLPAGMSAPSAGYVVNGYISGLTSATEKYGYATDMVSANTIMGPAQASQVAVVNRSFGILASGDVTIADTKTTIKMNYSTEVATVGTSLVNFHSQQPFAYGNAQQGYISGGRLYPNPTPLATTDTYTYASDAVGSGVSLSVARNRGSSFGTTSEAVIAGGTLDDSSMTSGVSTVDILTYASQAMTAGAALSSARWTGGSHGNAVSGLAAGGVSGGGYVSSIDKYSFANNTWAAGTSFSAITSHMGSHGPTAGGLQY